MNLIPMLLISGLAVVSLAGCSTTGERIGGAGVGAVSGPDVARDVGVPHRGYYYHHRRHRHWWHGQWIY